VTSLLGRGVGKVIPHRAMGRKRFTGGEWLKECEVELQLRLGVDREWSWSWSWSCSWSLVGILLGLHRDSNSNSGNLTRKTEMVRKDF